MKREQKLLHHVNEVLSEIELNGTSKLQVFKQPEPTFDSDYTIKFNSEGVVEWIYFNENSSERKAFVNINDDFQSNSNNLKVYPNPFDRVVNIQLESPKEKEVNLVLMNSIGATILQETVELNLGENDLSLNLAEKLIPNGFYVLSVIDDSGIIASSKLFKINKE